MEEQPITPHAGPVLDAEGHLTYIGDDGRRYVVGLPGSGGLLQQIEVLAAQWISQVSGPDLERAAAIALLLSTLETALEADSPDED